MIPIIVCCFILIIIVLALIIFPPSKGMVNPFLDSEGNVLEGSISEKCEIEVEDGKLGMVLLGKNEANPVLLVCGGGPGIPQYFMEHEYPSSLTDSFVVCYWDYRGTGLSYDADVKPDEMTTEQYLHDVKQVTEYLCNRFQQEKIYIMGHSFGTYVALNAIARYPEYYNAYLAMSQVCNQIESEYLAYDYMKNQYEQAGNSAMVKKFEACPIRENDTYYNQYFTSNLRDSAMHELGVGTTRDMNSVIRGIFFPSLRIKEYTWGERLHFWKGKIVSRDFAVTKESTHFNAFTDIPSVEIPVYFFAGEHDYTCAYSLQKEYYELLVAPKKEFFSFENSAHSPVYEEPERVAEIFEEIKAE